MDNVYNAKDYAQAKVVLKDLKDAYTIMLEIHKKLFPYMKYSSVLDAVKDLSQWYPIIQSQIKDYQYIVDTKGKVIPFPIPLKKE